MNQKSFPLSPAEWQSVIRESLGLEPEQARAALNTGRFPYARLEAWIRRTFTTGYAPEFVPALVRNLRGLATWVYQDGPEPFWPGADED